MHDDDFFVGAYGADYQSPDPPNSRYEPPAHADAHAAPVTATIYHGRKPVEWRTVAPYLSALAGVVVAVAVLVLTTTWRGAMQNQITTLQHDLATVQSQVAVAASSGQAQINSLSRRVNGIRTDVNGISDQIGPFTGTCISNATDPSGAAAFVRFPCRG